MCTFFCPLHLLLLDKAFDDHLVDGRFDKGRGDGLPITPALSVVGNQPLIVLDIGAEFLQRF